MIATCTAFLIVSHTALTVSAIAVNTLVTVSFMTSIFSDIAVLMFSQACLIESTKPVKNPLIASMAVLTASFTDSQAFVTASLNPSLVFHNVIKATTSPAIIDIINTAGFASMAVFNPVCATVAVSSTPVKIPIAVLTALISDDIAIATFKVTNPAATPAISGDQSLNV